MCVAEVLLLLPVPRDTWEGECCGEGLCREVGGLVVPRRGSVGTAHPHLGMGQLSPLCTVPAHKCLPQPVLIVGYRASASQRSHSWRLCLCWWQRWQDQPFGGREVVPSASAEDRKAACVPSLFLPQEKSTLCLSIWSTGIPEGIYTAFKVVVSPSQTEKGYKLRLRLYQKSISCNGDLWKYTVLCAKGTDSVKKKIILELVCGSMVLVWPEGAGV